MAFAFTEDPPLGAGPAATTSVGYAQAVNALTRARFSEETTPLFISVNFNPGDGVNPSSFVITVPIPAPLVYDSGTGAALFEEYYNVTPQFGTVGTTAGGVTFSFNSGAVITNRNFTFSVPVLSGGAIPPAGVSVTPQIQYVAGGVSNTLTLNPVVLLPASPSPTYLSGLKLTPDAPLQRALILTSFPVVFYEEIQSTFPPDALPGLVPSARFSIYGNNGAGFDPAAPIAAFLDGQDVTNQGVIVADASNQSVTFTFLSPQNLAGKTLVIRAKFLATQDSLSSFPLAYTFNEYSVDAELLGFGAFDVYGSLGTTGDPFISKLLRLTPESQGKSVLVVPTHESDVIVDFVVQIFREQARRYYISDLIPFFYDVVSENGEPVIQLLLNGSEVISTDGLSASYSPVSGFLDITYDPPSESLFGQLVVFRFTLIRSSSIPLPAGGVQNDVDLQVGFALTAPRKVDIGRLIALASLPLSPQTANAMRAVIEVSGGLPHAGSTALILPPGSPDLPEDCICPPLPCPCPCPRPCPPFPCRPHKGCIRDCSMCGFVRTCASAGQFFRSF